jgi:hypothetical protein
VKRTTRFIAFVFGLIAVLSASAQIYQWKDKDGKAHFSDRPPPSQPGIQMQTPTRAQPDAAADDPEPEAETTEGSGTEAKNAPAPAPASAQGKSQAEQRDEEFRKRRAAAAEAREKAEKDAARNAQREQGCQRARAQYAALNSGQRVSFPSEDGGRRPLNDEERAAAIARTRELMEAYCGKD